MGTQLPLRKGAEQPRLFGPCLFRPMTIVAKRSPISSTAELLRADRHTDIQTDTLVAILRTFTEGEVTKDHVTGHRLSFVA